MELKIPNIWNHGCLLGQFWDEQVLSEDISWQFIIISIFANTLFTSFGHTKLWQRNIFLFKVRHWEWKNNTCNILFHSKEAYNRKGKQCEQIGNALSGYSSNQIFCELIYVYLFVVQPVEWFFNYWTEDEANIYLLCAEVLVWLGCSLDFKSFMENSSSLYKSRGN